MTAFIRPAGALKNLFNDRSEIKVPAGRTVHETLPDLKVKPEVVAGVIVNGALQSKDYLIKEDDQVKLVAVMGGG